MRASRDQRGIPQCLHDSGALTGLSSGSLSQASIASRMVAGVTFLSEKVSTIDVRQRIGDMLNRVALRRDEFVIERKGKALAALVPIERLEQMRRFARRQALDFMTEQKGAGRLTERSTADLSLEAQAWARKPGRKPRPKAK